MTFLHRLRLRDNWPLLLSLVLVVVLLLIVCSLLNQRTAPMYQPAPGEVVEYRELIAEHQSRSTRLSPVFVVLYVVVAGTVFLNALDKSALIRFFSMALIFLSCAFICAATFIFTLQNDGTILRHFQSMSFGNHTYQLALANTLGGGGDWVESKYYVYQCESSGEKCTVAYSVINASYYGQGPEIAFLSVEGKSLFVILGEEKTLISTN